MAASEGVMTSALFQCGGMRHGKHHLYDALEAPQEEAVRDEDFD